MNQQELEQQLRNAIDYTVPSCWNQIQQQLSEETEPIVETEERESFIALQPKGEVINMENRKRKNWLWGIATAACCAVAFGFGVFMQQPANYIALDINPSIEIETNRLGKVISVVGINQDGKDLIANQNFNGDSLDHVVEDIMELTIEKGYLGKDKENEILITVSDNSKSQQTLAHLNKTIANYVDAQEMKVQVLNQKIAINDEVLEKAHQQGVSAGKMQVLERIAAEDESITLAELSDIRISDLMSFAEQHQIDFSDLLDDYEDVVDDALEQGAVSQNKENPSKKPTVTDGKAITEAKAKEIALRHAGLTSGEKMQVKTDRDEGQLVYEVTFWSGNVKYEYEIHGIKGTILDWDKDREIFDDDKDDWDDKDDDDDGDHDDDDRWDD